MKSKTVCPYCGNASGKSDNRGNYISCGGVLTAPEQEIPWERMNQSGSSYQIYSFPERVPPGFPVIRMYYGYDTRIFTIDEIREMVGLDEN